MVEQVLLPENIRFYVWKNVFVLSFGWFFLYMALLPLLSVQSSLNSVDGLGTVSLSVQTAMMILGSAFLTTSVIGKIGTKWGATIGAFLFSFYVAANFYPSWGTLLPTCALTGLSSAIMWPSQLTYLTLLSKLYSEHEGVDHSSINSRFFGVFYAIFYSSNILGNVASSLLLGYDRSETATRTFSYDPNLVCGASYCNEDLGTSFVPDFTAEIFNVTSVDGNFSSPSSLTSSRPNTSNVHALCTFCMACVLIASLLLGTLLDPLSRFGIVEKSDGETSALKEFGAALGNLRDTKQILLLPLTFYNGMDNYFLGTDFTKAFITCPLGVEHIGFITACSGFFGLLSAFFGGWFSSRRTRPIPVVVGALSHLIPAGVLLYLRPSTDNSLPQYLISSSWGIGTGIWSFQVAAFYGVVFSDNLGPASANVSIWNSLAQMLMFGFSHKLCVYVKIYFVLIVLSLGVVGYAAVEIILWRTSGSKTISTMTITKNESDNGQVITVF